MNIDPIAQFLLAIPLTFVSATADRPVESRKDATHVVSGRVEGIYERDSTHYRDYIVEIRVSKVEKGSGVKPGDIFRMSCYRRKPGHGSLDADSDGHDAVPKEGQEIKAFVDERKGKFEGIYPDWFDVLRPKAG